MKDAGVKQDWISSERMEIYTSEKKHLDPEKNKIKLTAFDFALCAKAFSSNKIRSIKKTDLHHLLNNFHKCLKS